MKTFTAFLLGFVIGAFCALALIIAIETYQKEQKKYANATIIKPQEKPNVKMSIPKIIPVFDNNESEGQK